MIGCEGLFCGYREVGCREVGWVQYFMGYFLVCGKSPYGEVLVLCRCSRSGTFVMVPSYCGWGHVRYLCGVWYL